jgi:hypothetical protein
MGLNAAVPGRAYGAERSCHRGSAFWPGIRGSCCDAVGSVGTCASWGRLSQSPSGPPRLWPIEGAQRRGGPCEPTIAQDRQTVQRGPAKSPVAVGDNHRITTRVIQILCRRAKCRPGESHLNHASNGEPLIVKRGDYFSCPQSFPHLWIRFATQTFSPYYRIPLREFVATGLRKSQIFETMPSTMMTVQLAAMEREKILDPISRCIGFVKDGTCPQPIERLCTRRHGACRISSCG